MKTRILSVIVMLAMLLTLAACGAAPQTPSEFEVRFELNGGELVSGKLLQRVTAGGSAAAPEVKREGYVFSGWSEKLDNVNENLVAVALWEAAEAGSEPVAEPAVFEVRFELNGGELVSGKLLQQVEEGGSAEAPEVRREGYEFTGWSEDLENVEGNLVAVALWTQLPEPSAPPAVYEVRFELNGGEFVSGKLLQRVEEGGSAEAPEVRREGYALSGWSESFDSVTGNIITVAKWAKLYTIRFNPAGGEILSGESEQLVREGDVPSLPEVARRNYAFSGWSPEIEIVTGDAVYSATWSPVQLSSEEVFSKISPAVVEVSAYEPTGRYYSLGSGFFIDDQGTFVTNYHVIDEAVSGEIALLDGSHCDILSVLGYDPILDVAVLKADISGNPYLTLAENGVTTGETIFALGSSEGLTSTFSTGIVSASERTIDGVRYIQITAPISHGNSGGPLVNVFGEVVGINTMGYREGQNLNFAIDIREIDSVDLSQSLTLQEVYDIQYPTNTGAATGAGTGSGTGSGTDTGTGSGSGTGSSAGSGSGSEGSDDSFYDVADRAEQEPNDTFLRSDLISNDTLIAGEVNVGDQDWFYLEIGGTCDVSLQVVPAYIEDMDYLQCDVYYLSEEHDAVLFDSLVYTDNEDYLAMSKTLHLNEGIYFLSIRIDGSYPYPEPVYYVILANW